MAIFGNCIPGHFELKKPRILGFLTNFNVFLYNFMKQIIYSWPCTLGPCYWQPAEYWKRTNKIEILKIEKDETKLKFGNPQNSAKLIQSHFADDQMSNAAKSAQYHFPFLILSLQSFKYISNTTFSFSFWAIPNLKEKIIRYFGWQIMGKSI